MKKWLWLRKKRPLFRRVLCLVLVGIFLCALCVGAAEEQEPQQQLQEQFSEQLEISGADQLTQQLSGDTQKRMRELGIQSIDFQTILKLTPGDFFSLVGSMLSDLVKRPLRILMALLGIILLCALLDGMRQSLTSEGTTQVFHVVTMLCACAVVLQPVMSSIQRTADTIKEGANFLVTFVPVFSTVMTLSGRPVSALGYQTLVFSAGQLVAQIAAHTLLPLMGVYLAMSITGAMAPGLQLAQVGKSIKTFVTWTLGLCVTVFVALLGLQSLVASSADGVSMKAAKFVLGSAIPVVGGALSEALSTAQACMGLLKTSIGVYAVIAVCITFLPALIEAILWCLVMKLASIAADVMGNTTLSGLFSAIQSTFGVLIAILSSFLLLVLVSTTIMMLVGSGG